MKEYELSILPEYVGGFGSVTTSGIVRLFQRAATRHSNDLGYGSSWRQNNNAAWMAREHHLERLESFPVEGLVTVRTTVEDMRRVRSLRTYEILGRDGETTLARGRTEWVFVNLKEGTLQRIPEQLKEAFDPASEGASPRREDLELPDVSPADYERSYELQFRDFDEQGHVNNVVYVDYLYETLLRWTLGEPGGRTFEPPRNGPNLNALSLRYLNQTHWDEPLICRIANGESEGTFVFQLKQGDKNTAEGRGTLRSGDL